MTSRSFGGYACAFCGRAQAECERLVAGQGVHICERCIALATEVCAQGVAKANDVLRLSPVSDAGARCMFCGRRRADVAGMAGTETARICRECLALCEPIAETRMSAERHRELDRKFGRRPPGL